MSGGGRSREELEALVAEQAAVIAELRGEVADLKRQPRVVELESGEKNPTFDTLTCTC